MAKPYAVVHNPNRSAIEAAILAGEPYDKIAARHNVTACSISAFARDHLNVHRNASLGKQQPAKGMSFVFQPTAGAAPTTWLVVGTSRGYAHLESGHNGTTKSKWVPFATLLEGKQWKRVLHNSWTKERRAKVMRQAAAVVPVSGQIVVLPPAEPASAAPAPGIPEVLDELGRIFSTLRQMLTAMQATSNDVAALLNEWVK